MNIMFAALVPSSDFGFSITRFDIFSLLCLLSKFPSSFISDLCMGFTFIAFHVDFGD